MPIKSVKMKISKNKKISFFLMSQGSLNPKIRFLGQKVCHVACLQTDTKVNTKGTISWFQEYFLQTFHQWSVQKVSYIGAQDTPPSTPLSSLDHSVNLSCIWCITQHISCPWPLVYLFKVIFLRSVDDYSTLTHRLTRSWVVFITHRLTRSWAVFITMKRVNIGTATCIYLAKSR